MGFGTGGLFGFLLSVLCHWQVTGRCHLHACCVSPFDGAVGEAIANRVQVDYSDVMTGFWNSFDVSCRACMRDDAALRAPNSLLLLGLTRGCRVC
jgi:hypothetical protein